MNWSLLVESYLAQKQQLGYSLEYEAQQLKNFASFAEKQSDGTKLSVALALRWANLAPSGSEIAIARRFSLLRPFSRYLSMQEYGTVILPAHFIGPTHRRLPPYIFSKTEITRLMIATLKLFPGHGLRPVTMETIIGLIVSTGIRPGEAVRLQIKDVAINSGEIIINDSKGWLQRAIAISPSTGEALKKYVHFRDCVNSSNQTDAFFQFDRGQALNIQAADYAFRLLRDAIGLTKKINGRYPRLYDLRHTFVCQRVITWYRSGEDIDCRVVQLSRHLGHKNVRDTYWYLTAIPELMACAAKRFSGHIVKGEQQ